MLLSFCWPRYRVLGSESEWELRLIAKIGEEGKAMKNLEEEIVSINLTGIANGFSKRPCVCIMVSCNGC